MGSQLSSHLNWINLPNEIKLKIIQNADKSSRLALKACSLNDYQLVASVPFRSIYKMHLWNREGQNWRINITRNIYGCEESLIFDTFEEFKKKLEEEIERSDFIDSLELDQEETSNQLKFTKSGELLKVRELIFSAHYQDAPNILSQIDPSFLKCLKLDRNGVHRGIFETPQVKQAHQFYVRESNVTDDQLLDMENSEILIYGTGNITFTGVNQYIKKCLLNLDNKPVYFRIEFLQATEQKFQGIEIQSIISDSSEQVPSKPEIFRVGSRLNNYQLEIEYWPAHIKGITICRNHHPERHRDSDPPQNSFKSVDSVTIEPDRFTIAERNTAPVTYISDSTDDLQEKLIEEMNKINYIKHLKLLDTSFNWQLCPPNKRATIGQLSVYRGSFNSDFLRQIEPIHLKEITIDVSSHDGEIYKMPQLIYAQKLDITNSNIQDEDLIRMNAIQTIMGPGPSKMLTNSGINKFIKNILTNLNMQEYHFKICHSGGRKSARRLKGLDIYSSKRIGYQSTKIIVNSPFPEFKLKLLYRREIIVGKRVTAEYAEKSRQVNAGNDDSDYSDGVY